MFILLMLLPPFILKVYYAEMYPTSLAAVSTCDYAFGLNDSMHTFHGGKKILRQIWSNNWKPVDAYWRHLIVTVLKYLNFALTRKKKHFSLDTINHCICVFLTEKLRSNRLCTCSRSRHRLPTHTKALNAAEFYWAGLLAFFFFSGHASIFYFFFITISVFVNVQGKV